MNRSRSISATSEGLTKVGKRMAQLEQPENLAKPRKSAKKGWTQQNLADRSGVSIDTVKRFLKGNPVDRKFIIWITEALGLEITQIVDPKDWNPAEQTSDAIDWREVCGEVLAQQREKQNFRRAITGRHLGHEAKNVYVKLGLVKPKEQPRRGDESQPSADRGTLQYQLTEKEIEQEYQYDEFLEQVIEGKEKNFTIVGEPGAGKSTWLEQIALYVDNSNQGFPICISLASLGGKTLEEYLFQIWLKNALLISQCDVGITSAQKKLEELFKSGKVWLLLDGVDEMRADESPLQAIATQLEGWGDLARVVLTCRSNVWEVNPNTLLNFETYRTLRFDDEQVGDFIQQWFTQEGKPELGKQLETKLDESRNDRIRDLIKNPLRLAMLCGIWYFHQGDLPKTKATLYQQYIEYFYRWKQHPQLTEDLDKQEELHAALSKLALEAIDKKLPLRRKFVHKVMGKSLFQLARDVGWLNWVYKDAETGEDVYAFFHLTFQEYFAACAIDDWRYFLNHDNENPNPLLNPNPSLEYDDGKPAYRIFEPHWKEVILLWLGRPHEEVAIEQKNQFIQALVEFEDGIKYDFYRFRSYFLAATGIAEFRDYHLAHKIVRVIIDISFGDFNRKKQRWVRTIEPIAEIAKEVLKETDRARTIPTLINLLPFIIDENACQEAASSLGQIDPGNSLAIETLIHLGQNAQEKWTREQAFESLRQIANGNTIAIQAMIQIIQTMTQIIEAEFTWNEYYFPLYEACKTFGKIAKGRTIVIQFLEGKLNIYKNAKNEDLIHIFADTLREVDSSNTLAMEALNELIKTSEYEWLLYIVADTLRKIDSSDSIARDVLNELVKTSEDEWLRQQSARSLELDKVTRKPFTQNGVGIEKYNPENFNNCLEKMLQITNNLKRHLYVCFLINKFQDNCLRLAVLRLKDCLTEQLYKNDRERFKDYYSVILHCAQNMPYPDFYQAWHQPTIHQRG